MVAELCVVPGRWTLIQVCHVRVALLSIHEVLYTRPVLYLHISVCTDVYLFTHLRSLIWTNVTTTGLK